MSVTYGDSVIFEIIDITEETCCEQGKWQKNMLVESIVAVPPDGGWGWVIVAVSFYTYVVIDVPSIGFQVILNGLMDNLEIAASAASIIFSTYTLMFSFMGPLAGGICNRFGFKATTICGCLFMLVGFIVSFFLSNLICFIIFFGLIAGFGSSLVYMVANVAPGFWFEEKRAIALGLASSATGFALFTVLPTTKIKDAFGWRWCFMFWTACIALLGGLAFLLKMPPLVELEQSKSELIIEHNKKITDLDYKTSIISVRPIRKTMNIEQELADEKLHKLATTFGVSVRESQSAPTSFFIQEERQEINSGCARCFRILLCQGSYEIGARPLYRDDIFYSGSITHAVEIEKMERDTYGLCVTHLPTERDIRQELECKFKIPEALVRVVYEMIDFSLFKSTAFLLLVVAMLFASIAVYIPFLLIKVINLGKMDESSASMLTMMMGLGTLVCRGTIGFLLYFFPKIKALQVMIVFAMLGGFVICIVPLNYSVPYQMTVSFLGGAFPAVLNPLKSIVIIEMVGLKKLTNTTGILCFVQGIGCFIGMPIAELLNELSNTRYLGMVFSGVCYIVAGFGLVGIAVLASLKNKAKPNDGHS